MQTQFKSFSDFKQTLENNIELQEEFKKDPINAVKSLGAKGPWFNDKLIYRLVVLFLGIIVLTICIGVIILTCNGVVSKDFDVPDILIATASTAIGAIAGLLTPGTNQN